MKVKRNKLNEQIAKDVMTGKIPSYHNNKNGNKCWSINRRAEGEK